MTISNQKSAIPRRQPRGHLHCCWATWRNSSHGQAMVEYLVIAGLLMASLGILTVFLVTFKEYGGRILAMVSSEYP